MFTVTKQQPRYGPSTCRRCRRAIFLAPSKKNPNRTITVDERVGPYLLEEQDDGTVVAAWAGPSAGYAYHYNSDLACATDTDVADAQ